MKILGQHNGILFDIKRPPVHWRITRKWRQQLQNAVATGTSRAAEHVPGERHPSLQRFAYVLLHHSMLWAVHYLYISFIQHHFFFMFVCLPPVTVALSDDLREIVSWFWYGLTCINIIIFMWKTEAALWQHDRLTGVTSPPQTSC